MSEKTRRIFDWILEILWLSAVVWITLYFNIYTKDSRIFEPQKALILRTLVTLMLAVWAIKVLEASRSRLHASRSWWRALIVVVVLSALGAVGLFTLGLVTWSGGPLDGMLGYNASGRLTPIGPMSFPIALGLLEIPVNFVLLFGVGLALAAAINLLRTSWKEALRTAMVIPALAYIAVHIVATIGSVFPLASLYGGYVRQQGTLSVLAYIGLAFILATTLRRREQLERLITVILLTSLPSALYGVVQKMGVDPLPWMGNVEARVASTMGNAIFIAAYLIMVLPLTGYRLLRTWKQIQASPPPEETPAPRPSLHWYRPALVAFVVVIALILLILLIGVPVYISAQTASLQQQGLPTTGVMDWSEWVQGLGTALGTMLVTAALPALLYSVLGMIRSRWRPFLVLGGGGVLGLALAARWLLPAAYPGLRGEATWEIVSWGVLALLALAWLLLCFWPEHWRPYNHLVAVTTAFGVAAGILLLPLTRDNGFAWAGYLLGLGLLALASAWMHYREPWGQDSLWTDAVYLLLVGQSVMFYIAILLYLPSRPYPTLDMALYPLAIVFFLASCFIVLRRRVAGRVGYIAQLLGYLALAGLQVLCIFLTQSRGPMLGLLAGVAVFVLLTLLVVARNARRQEEGPLEARRAAPTAVAAFLVFPLFLPLLAGSALLALLAALEDGLRSLGQQMRSFLRPFWLSWADFLQALGLFGLGLLNLFAAWGILAGLLGLGGMLRGILPQMPTSAWVVLASGGLALFAAALLATVGVLYGPGLPRSPRPWLVALGLTLLGLLPGCGLLGLFAAMVTLRRGRRWLWMSLLLTMILVLFVLAVYNLPDTPLLGDLLMGNPQVASLVEDHIQPLKKIQYIGRLGKLFAASETTGRVRVLIWFGDEIGRGAVGMIEHHPLRTLIGYGPEAMHVAYNPYYPPELAHVEKRNASPDRSHNAIFDELVTMGVLGLAAYLFYFLAFFVLVWRLLGRSPGPHWQALLIALFSVGMAHFVETITGIPIVSTRMYMWLMIGVAVALTCMPPFRREEAGAAPLAEPTPTSAVARHRRRRTERFRKGNGLPALWTVGYTAIGLAALLLSYRVNLKPMVADVLFWQAQMLQSNAAAYEKQLSQISDETARKNAQTLIDRYTREGLDSLQQAIYLMPHEDFYYLSLAQIYLSGAGQAGSGVEQLFQSTQRAIERARDLSPLNTDHYRNMAALYMAWFGTAGSPRNPSALLRAVAYGEQAISLTPNNADLHNRLAQAYMVASTATPEVQQSVVPAAQAWLQDWARYHLTAGGRAGDAHLPLVARYREEAWRLLGEGEIQRGFWALAAAELQYSLFLDERYASTYLTLGDLYRTLGMPGAAALTYESGLAFNPDLLSDGQFEARLRALGSAGELEPLFRAYGRVAERAEATLAGLAADAPQATKDTWKTKAGAAYQTLAFMATLRNEDQVAIDYYLLAQALRPTYEGYKNMALLYNDVGQYDQAIAQAQAALQIAQSKQNESDVQALQAFIRQIQAKLEQQLTLAQGQVQESPADYQAHYRLADLYRQAGRLEEALAAAQQAAQQVPAVESEAVARVHNLLGQCAFQNQQYGLAEQAFRRVLEVAPQDFEASYGLARLYQVQGRTAEARSQAEAALRVASRAQALEVQALLLSLPEK